MNQPNEKLRGDLVHLLVEYDRKQSQRARGYNRNALPLYCAAAARAGALVAAGLSWPEALKDTFTHHPITGHPDLPPVRRFLKMLPPPQPVAEAEADDALAELRAVREVELAYVYDNGISIEDADL